MKRLTSILLSLLIVGSSVLGGCKNKNTSEGKTPESSAATSSVAAPTDKEADIVVIGGGGAGMTAALQASQNGAKNVVIVEKMPQTGGNTVYATGGLNASETSVQKKLNVKDSNQLFIDETIAGGKKLNNPELVKTMVEGSAAAVDWINQIGGDLSELGRSGGMSVDRLHRPKGGAAVGPMIVKTLNENIEKENIPVLLNTTAKEIVLNDKNAIAGVKVADASGEYTIKCKAVVLAAGGFGANSDMVVKYAPNLKGFGTTNHKGATGDGIILAEKANAALVDMEKIQTHPTVEPSTSVMYTEGVRGDGGILVNKEGKRFINELETRDVVSAAILEQPEAISYLIFDQSVREKLSAIEKYINLKIIEEAETPEELAKKIGVDPTTFAETMKAYSQAAASGVDKDFGRKEMKSKLDKPKYYAGKCAPAIHHTMGGVKINTVCEVLKADNAAIPGFFAAGEVTGGVHGGNRIGGNAMADIIVFGRIAANSACKYVEANGGYTEPSIVLEEAETPAVPEVKGNFKDGEYTGKGKGNNGDIEVKVTVKDSSIVSIQVTKHSETPGIYENAEKNVINSIIKKQALKVDTVAGATNSSKGIMEAVNNALNQK